MFDPLLWVPETWLDLSVVWALIWKRLTMFGWCLKYLYCIHGKDGRFYFLKSTISSACSCAIVWCPPSALFASRISLWGSTLRPAMCLSPILENLLPAQHAQERLAHGSQARTWPLEGTRFSKCAQFHSLLVREAGTQWVDGGYFFVCFICWLMNFWYLFTSLLWVCELMVRPVMPPFSWFGRNHSAEPKC